MQNKFKKVVTLSSILLILISSIYFGENAKAESEKIQFDIFGYSVDPTSLQPIQSNITGKMFIQLDVEKNINISLDIGRNIYQFSKLQCFVENYYYNENEYRQIYRINNVSIGFFAEFHIYTQFIWVNLVFCNENLQMNFDGVIKRSDFSIQINPIRTKELICNFNDFITAKIYDSLSEIDFLNEKKAEQISNIGLNNSLYINQIQEQVPSYSDELISPRAAIPLTISTQNFGILHECDANQEQSEFSTISSHLVDYSGINTVIHRYNPTYSQVLSDIQYYCRDTYNSHYSLISKNDLRAYEMLADGSILDTKWILRGNKHWDSELGWIWDNLGTIDDIDISDLWGSYTQPDGGEYVYYPNDCIILAFTDYSYAHSTSATPYMAKSWVDHGADSFVGSICSINEGSSGTHSQSFWDALSISNHNCYSATQALCTSGSWSYGADWKIYGSISSVLP